MGRASWILAIVVALFGALSFGSPARAGAFPDAQGLRICVTRDTGQTPAAMMSRRADFDCTTRQEAFGPGDYWVRAVDLPAGTSTTLTHLRSRWQWQRRSQLFVGFGDGSMVAHAVETSTTAERDGRPDDLALPQSGREATTLLWRVGGSANIRRIMGESHVVSFDQAARHDLRTTGMLAAYMGMGFALLTYNLVLWVALRRRFQLAYCALAACLLAYAVLSSGLPALLLPGVDRNLWAAANYGLVPVALAAGLWFAATLIGRRLPRRLHRCCTMLSTMLLIATALTFVVPLDRLGIVDRLQGVLAAAMLALTVVLLADARRHGATFLALVVLALAGPVFLAAMRVANTFHLLPFLVAIREWTVILLAAQALACSLAVAWRIQRLARERDEARAQEAVARLLADTDPLTGLLNRRAFLERAVGRTGPQLLILADLDHFKAINETIGHDGGDEVLRGFARMLSETLPPGALAARMGGEEFAIVADASERLSPGIVSDALRRVRTPFDLAVTTSVGTCTGPLAEEADWTALYRRADQALFAAKAAGRDRVRDATSLPGAGLTLAA